MESKSTYKWSMLIILLPIGLLSTGDMKVSKSKQAKVGQKNTWYNNNDTDIEHPRKRVNMTLGTSYDSQSERFSETLNMASNANKESLLALQNFNASVLLEKGVLNSLKEKLINLTGSYTKSHNIDKYRMHPVYEIVKYIKNLKSTNSKPNTDKPVNSGNLFTANSITDQITDNSESVEVLLVKDFITISSFRLQYDLCNDLQLLETLNPIKNTNKTLYRLYYLFFTCVEVLFSNYEESLTSLHNNLIKHLQSVGNIDNFDDISGIGKLIDGLIEDTKYTNAKVKVLNKTNNENIILNNDNKNINKVIEKTNKCIKTEFLTKEINLINLVIKKLPNETISKMKIKLKELINIYKNDYKIEFFDLIDYSQAKDFELKMNCYFEKLIKKMDNFEAHYSKRNDKDKQILISEFRMTKIYIEIISQKFEESLKMLPYLTLHIKEYKTVNELVSKLRDIENIRKNNKKAVSLCTRFRNHMLRKFN